jgi:hypothetical protein
VLVVAAVLGLDEAPQVLVLAAGGLKIEDEVLDAQPQVVEGLLQVGDGLFHPLVAFAGLAGHLVDRAALRLGQGVDLPDQFPKPLLKVLLVHGPLLGWSGVGWRGCALRGYRYTRRGKLQAESRRAGAAPEKAAS